MKGTRTLYTDPAAVARRSELGRLTKPTLAEMMIRGGTIYPPRSGLMLWRKDELVMGVLRQEFPDLPEAVPAQQTTDCAGGCCYNSLKDMCENEECSCHATGQPA